MQRRCVLEVGSRILCALIETMQRNPFGFFMLLAVAIWIAYTIVRALKTGEIHSRGMYKFQREGQPFMYCLVLLTHVAIVVGFAFALTTFE